MHADSNADGRNGDRAALCDVRLATRVSRPVSRRLRLLALIQDQPISHVLTQLLDQALPPADELIDQLRRDEPAEAVA